MTNIGNLNRDKAIDIAKAIGILLMILGHCPGLPHIINNFIFSFHMPLFFILSGYFYKPKTTKNLFLSGSKHLVKPYIITSVFCILLCVAIGDLELIKNKIIGTFMANGGWPSEMFGSDLPYIGPIWFVLALFWCKIFYGHLKQKTDKCLLWSFVISSCALLIGKHIINLPLGILTGFCGMIFYCIGDYWRNRIKTPIKAKYLMYGVAIWLFCIWKAHLELASFDCSLYPISMFAAFIGTYVIFLLSKKVPIIIYPVMIWIGQNTMLILCYHTISTFLIKNMMHHLIEPNGISLQSLTISIIRCILSLGLPYLHTTIRGQLNRRLSIA